MVNFLNDVCEYCEDPDRVLFKNTLALIYLNLLKGYTKWPVYDLGGFGMSMMLAAKELGVDSTLAYELLNIMM